MATTSLTPAPTPTISAEPTGTPIPLPGAATEVLIAGYVATLQNEPENQEALLLLGLAYYQHARETADATDYARAEQAFDRLLELVPDSAEAIIGKATIALARHDFTGALALGQQALALTQVSRVYGVIADAQVELGLYDDAVASVQQMVNTRPDLSSYSRVSYLRELYGQLDGAIDAMEQAVQAGGPATENTEYVRVLLGNLWFLKGDLEKAEASYAGSLARSPGYVFALAGLGRVKAARGDLDGAIALFQEAADRVPFAEFLILLGETQQAAGKTAEAEATYAYVRDIQGLFKANGVDTDVDLALFDAEHGTDPAAAVTLARPAYERAPNFRGADALAWALYKDGQLDEARQRAEEALQLGTLDPLYLYHAGMIAVAQGDVDKAREWLTAALSMNPDFSPLHAPRAQAALDALGDSTP
ncbi:MAG: tetratricopeptide repeat protein [Candidatus Limnocylindrales bacterium]